MIVRLEPITEPGPACQVQEVHHGKTILVPRPCAEVLPPTK